MKGEHARRSCPADMKNHDEVAGMLAARALVIALLASTACAPPSGDDTEATDTSTTTAATQGHSSTPTTTATGDDGGTTTITTATTATTTDPGHDSVPVFPEETEDSRPLDPPPGPCSPWLEDCPPSQKCTPFTSEGAPSWDTLACAPIIPDPVPPGAACVVLIHPASGLDNCQKHAFCWAVGDDLEGTCVGMCDGDISDRSCSDPARTCVLFNGGILPLCLPTCDPLVVDCPNDQVCIPTLGAYACAPDVSGPGGALFSACTAGNACDPGLVCASAELTAQCDTIDPGECCQQLCDLASADACPPAQECTPWFAAPPPDLAHVGVCTDA